MNLPPTAVLSGYIMLGSFMLSPSVKKFLVQTGLNLSLYG